MIADGAKLRAGLVLARQPRPVRLAAIAVRVGEEGLVLGIRDGVLGYVEGLHVERAVDVL